MINLLKKIVLAIGALLIMRILAIWVIMSSGHLSEVVERDFDPSIMFYTESEEVLKAEKHIESTITEIKTPF